MQSAVSTPHLLLQSLRFSLKYLNSSRKLTYHQTSRFLPRLRGVPFLLKTCTLQDLSIIKLRCLDCQISDHKSEDTCCISKGYGAGNHPNFTPTRVEIGGRPNTCVGLQGCGVPLLQFRLRVGRVEVLVDVPVVRIVDV